MVAGIDPDPANAGVVSDWARGFSDATRPYAMPGGYSNFQMDEEPDRVRGMYGANYDRLARIKAQYDPDNVFRVNQNIQPATVARVSNRAAGVVPPPAHCSSKRLPARRNHQANQITTMTGPIAATRRITVSAPLPTVPTTPES